MTTLRVQSLGKRYGGVVALDAAGFDIEAPGIYGLIGPNGARPPCLMPSRGASRPTVAP